jgi:hypothetical protein
MTRRPEGPHERRWDDHERPSVAVVELVAALTGREPAALPPFGGTVDADAFDTLLTGGVDWSDAPVQVSFEYAGAEVTATSDGGLSVRFPGDDAV